MPGTNQFLPFAVGAGANTLTPTASSPLGAQRGSRHIDSVADDAEVDVLAKLAMALMFE